MDAIAFELSKIVIYLKQFRNVFNFPFVYTKSK